MISLAYGTAALCIFATLAGLVLSAEPPYLGSKRASGAATALIVAAVLISGGIIVGGITYAIGLVLKVGG